MSGIDLAENDLSGWNFAGQNLTNATFGTRFLSAELYATLTDADFTGADARGAHPTSAFCDAITTNLIRPDGHINGLDLDAGGCSSSAITMATHDGGTLPPIPITVDQHLAMGPGGTLRMVFEADAWDSTISFAPGIPVTLGGTLELTFADDVNLASQVGRTFDLFDWTGVSPTGASPSPALRLGPLKPLHHRRSHPHRHPRAEHSAYSTAPFVAVLSAARV